MDPRVALIGASLLAFHASEANAAPTEEQPKPAPPASEEPASDKPGDGGAKHDIHVKTREVKLDRLTLQVPVTWKQAEPSSKLRLGEFKIPAAAGDEDEPVELAVFSFGGGGSVRQNIERWINQFDAAGREAKLTRGKSPQGEYVFVDVTGTYHKPVGPPILQKTERLPDARMLAVILAVKDQGVYYLKLAGPKQTVSANAGHFRKAFAADAEKEQPLKLDGEADESDSR